MMNMKMMNLSFILISDFINDIYILKNVPKSAKFNLDEN